MHLANLALMQIVNIPHDIFATSRSSLVQVAIASSHVVILFIGVVEYWID